jgi:hypothetical protein
MIPTRYVRVAAVSALLFSVGIVAATLGAGHSEASPPWRWCRDCCQPPCNRGCLTHDLEVCGEPGGTWYWLRSPEEERRVIIGLYNRYCIRCHGVDGRGVWDIPDVPDFTNPQWQASRSDGQLARATLEGRGACMPPFRGTLTLEEAWGMARYLRTFVPGTEVSRPDLTQPAETTPSPVLPAPKSK